MKVLLIIILCSFISFNVSAVIIVGSSSNPAIGQNQTVQSADTLDKMRLHVIPQSHIDLSWWWRYDPETIHIVVKHTLETAFGNMEKFPDYTFTHLQVPAMEPLERLYPELFYKLRFYVHKNRAMGLGVPNPGASGSNGRLDIGSGLWCEPDGSLPCGESLVRQCLYGKRWYNHQFGIDVKTAWFVDAWTHPWTYPQILKKSGIDSYMFYRGEEDKSMFWWESADGSRVFAYKPLMGKDESLISKELIDEYLLGLNKKYGIHDGITLIGVGNHGGGAIKADVERMRQVMQERNSDNQNKKKQSQLLFSTPKQFTSAILDHPGNFPVKKYELQPTIRGAYTTVGEIKKGNRYSENLLLSLEQYASLNSAMGIGLYPAKPIYNAWKKLMINQFHDAISGTDVLPSIDDVLLRFQQIRDTASVLLNGQLQSITQNINTLGVGTPIVVFNPLSWKRTDVVEAFIELPLEINYFSIVNGNGQSVPLQISEKKEEQGIHKFRVIFLAEDIPSMGYSTFHLKNEKSKPISKNVIKGSKYRIENEFFDLKIDSLTGCLSGITDKKNNREVLQSNVKGNLIQIIDDFGDSEGFLCSPEGEKEVNSWKGKTSDVLDHSEIELIENGPVRATIQIKRKFQLARFIQRITLYAGIQRVDFDLNIDWNGKNKMVKVAFPLSVKNDSAVYDIPYGTILRPSLGEEQVGQKWADLSDKNYGVSLLNDSRYGYDITKNTIRLSVLRSPDHPVESLDDKGTHQINYALYPHNGDWRDGRSMNKGFEFNNPLIAVVGAVHKGKLPAKHSFIEISPESLIVTVLKKAEDSDDLMLRFYETVGQKCTAKIKLSEYLGVDGVHKTDLLENELEDIPQNKSGFDVPVGKYSIESFKLIKDLY
jgi:alpha-mannosidase